ncbi:nuclear transport factor 2 family protein [Sphingomonas sp. CL5.1]|uniref:nuclear transport factor 2 family protein n=1 Tax=Sphingomonas sp. CL5.1 TaxID=2653203 RepID=UPI001582C89A|nr:nuclear transport factor 2 family protein [Sphingomonas sp. CL5.1]QKS00603.1 nuclear transport factor 2 family protein [Sphingomonas sp. CL5.1]
MAKMMKALLSCPIMLAPVIASAAMGRVANQPAIARPAELSGMARLLAMEEMKNLRMTFCRALDGHDWIALRSVITDDFEQYFAETDGPGGPDVRPPIRTKGGDAYVDFVKTVLTGQSIHICTMPQFVSVTANHAQALWFINGYGNIAGRSGLGYERLVEDYVHVDGKWRISKVDARIEAHVGF